MMANRKAEQRPCGDPVGTWRILDGFGLDEIGGSLDGVCPYVFAVCGLIPRLQAAGRAGPIPNTKPEMPCTSGDQRYRHLASIAVVALKPLRSTCATTFRRALDTALLPAVIDVQRDEDAASDLRFPARFRRTSILRSEGFVGSVSCLGVQSRFVRRSPVIVFALLSRGFAVFRQRLPLLLRAFELLNPLARTEVQKPIARVYRFSADVVNMLPV